MDLNKQIIYGPEIIPLEPDTQDSDNSPDVDTDPPDPDEFPDSDAD